MLAIDVAETSWEIQRYRLNSKIKQNSIRFRVRRAGSFDPIPPAKSRSASRLMASTSTRSAWRCLRKAEVSSLLNAAQARSLLLLKEITEAFWCARQVSMAGNQTR